MFKEYKYGVFKKEIRQALRERLKLKEKIRVHTAKQAHHALVKKNFEDALKEVEKELNDLLQKAGNNTQEETENGKMGL